jgi:predicted nucleic acid-binding protein
MIVCNASPLIALASLDRLDLLDRLFGDWCVPERVASECAVDRKAFATRLRAAMAGRHVRVLEPKALKQMVETEIHLMHGRLQPGMK